MLERLEVQGLGIIDEVVLEPPAGLVALTGETGAGKSLLVESLKLLAGQRAQAEMVRSGAPGLRVQGWFSVADPEGLAGELDELGVAADGGLILRREVTAAGRSRAWINDVPVTAGALQKLAPRLLAIHGQHEQYGLADPAEQRRMVDEFAGHGGLLDRVAALHDDYRAAAARVAELEAARAARRDRLDAIAFQLAEIDAVAPRAGEVEELEQKRRVLRHAVKIRELAAAVLGRLVDGDAAVQGELARAEREAEELARCGVRLDEGAARLREARILVEETVREIQGLTAGVEPDPAELESVEGRLHRLEQLVLKYGSPLEAVLEHRERLQAERRELESVEDRLQEARARAEAALAAYAGAAEELDAARREAGEALLAAAAEILGRLDMGGTLLELRWTEREDPQSPLERRGRRVRFDAGGVAECELLIAANPGETPRPMARIASGGELSRLHLALRTALRGRLGGRGMTLLFDEVDAGLGGATAAALGGVLAELAEVDQVLVVTHLPQVAARAASQIRVEKVMAGGRAVTRVTPLSAEERVAELARMLAGERVQASALEHARALLQGP
jgi:DNA repair protein RecN